MFLLGAIYIFTQVPEIADPEDEDVAADAWKAPWVGQPFRKQYMLFASAITSFIWMGGQGSMMAFFVGADTAHVPTAANVCFRCTTLRELILA